MHHKERGKVKKTIIALLKTMKWIFIVFFVFLGSLFFREQRFPRSWANGIADHYSSSNVLIRCEGAAFGFWRGLRLIGVKVYDRDKEDCLEPVVAARSVAVNPLARKVRIVGAKYPRLPDSYYHGECRERNSRVEAEFPRLPEFSVVLEDPEILGLAPSRVTAQVNVRGKWIIVDDICVRLPWNGRDLTVDGSLRVDLVSQTVTAAVRGLAMPEQIRPLIVALDVPSALPYMDAFTEIPEPVPANGEFDVNLVNGDFHMVLNLKPTMGRYNGVPMSRAEGTLDLLAYTRGTNCNVKLNVSLPYATDTEGARLGGSVALTLIEGLPRLAYDVSSELSLKDALAVADLGFLTPDTLSMLVCDTKPSLKLKGTSGTSVADSGHNDIAFSVGLAKGSFMGFQLRDADADFRLKGEGMEFTRVDARGKAGGKYDISARLDFPEYDADRMSFGMKAKVEEGTLDEIADFLGFDVGDRDGRVDGWCEFDGPIATNGVERLCGAGSVRIKEGHLAQMKLFAGLTKLLAERVPGVSYIVNQSDASADFTVTNGVLRTENVFIEGGLISLKGWGSYDIAKDDLDFTVRVQFLKNESLMGKLVHPVTWPFTKLLLEFKARGKIDNPEWDYISILDRII